MSEKKRYTFHLDKFRYCGTIISETATHFIIEDEKDGRIHIPKSNVVIKEAKP